MRRLRDPRHIEIAATSSSRRSSCLWSVARLADRGQLAVVDVPALASPGDHSAAHMGDAYCSCQATSEVPATKIRRFSPAAGPEGGIGPPFSLSVLIGTGDTPIQI